MRINGTVSVVIPLLNEKENLKELYPRLKKVLEETGDDYEIIFVDDGSTDGSLDVLKSFSSQDPKVKIISFRKNFGKATALHYGFKAANGDVIITMDADLQDMPEEIPTLLKKLEEGYDLVSGWKFDRKDGFIKRFSSKIFNSITSFVSGVKLHDFNCGLKAYRKETLKELELYGELHRFIPLLVNWKGFKVGEVKVNHAPRKYGESKFGGERFLRGFFDLLTVTLLTKYTHKPLHLFGLLGLLLSTGGFVINLYLTILWFSGKFIGHRPLLMLGILLMIIGIQFIFFGLLAELVVFSTRGKEYPIVKEKIGF